MLGFLPRLILMVKADIGFEGRVEHRLERKGVIRGKRGRVRAPFLEAGGGKVVITRVDFSGGEAGIEDFADAAVVIT